MNVGSKNIFGDMRKQAPGMWHGALPATTGPAALHPLHLRSAAMTSDCLPPFEALPMRGMLRPFEQRTAVQEEEGRRAREQQHICRRLAISSQPFEVEADDLRA